MAGSAKKQGLMRPGMTPESREEQMVNLAINAAEKQLRDGTASSQVITHFLKIGSTKERLEKEILEENKKLVVAKTESMQSNKRIEELYAEALSAMRNYAGQTPIDASDEEYEADDY